jgi:hypothetical protein
MKYTRHRRVVWLGRPWHWGLKLTMLGDWIFCVGPLAFQQWTTWQEGGRTFLVTHPGRPLDFKP